MCVVSLVSDHYLGQWHERHPQLHQIIQPNIFPGIAEPTPEPLSDSLHGLAHILGAISRKEFDELKK
jgi:hypothetical protein